MTKIGIIGLGYWGPNLVRNFNGCPEAELVMVCDQREDARAKIQRMYPAVEATDSADTLINDPRIEAVVVATPVSTHHALALQALRAGKHVLVEKPIADSAAHGEELIAEAEKQGITLMVDHTFPYTPAVKKIKELVQSGELGEIRYYDSTRINLGLFQHDVNVIWDLAVHDLSILEQIMPNPPRAVSATGISHVPGQPENIAYLSLFYSETCLAHIHVNWLAPVKIRQCLIGGSEKMIVYDETDVAEKIKIYDKGITLAEDPADVYKLRVGYRAGDMWAPRLDTTEALSELASHFVDCIQTGAQPMTDAVSGTRIVKVMEAATQSMAEKGRLIELD